MNRLTDLFDEAKEILGDEKIVTPDEALFIWDGKKKIVAELTHGFTTDTLVKAKKENDNGQAFWALIYSLGKSLSEQHYFIGSDRIKQPYFNDTYPFFQEHDLAFAKEKSLPRPVLINFVPIIENANYKQTKNFFQNNAQYEWCNERIFTEAVIDFAKKRGLLIAKVWFHRGPSIVDDQSIIIGEFNGNGLAVKTFPTEKNKEGINSVAMRKFDF